MIDWNWEGDGILVDGGVATYSVGKHKLSPRLQNFGSAHSLAVFINSAKRLERLESIKDCNEVLTQALRRLE